VQFDRGVSVEGPGDWYGARRFLIRMDRDQQTITSPVLEDLGPTNMARTDTLQQFVTWATTHFPADHTALVLWNHGAGWRSRAPGQSRGILFDDSSGSYMTMEQLHDALAGAKAHIDLTAIDCSLMAMLEVCHEIREQTDYIVASEESPPASGYPYDTILSQLVANPEMAPEGLGRIITDAHVGAYPDYGVTQSLVQTSRLPELCRWADALAAAILAVLPQRQAELAQAISVSQPYAFAYYRDLYDFARNVRSAFPDAAVQQAADAVMQAIPADAGGAVLAERHNLAGVMGSHGLSIYLPQEGEFYGGYGSLRFCRDYPGWNSLAQAAAGVTVLVSPAQ